jgi:hypothetical protein
LMTRRDTAFLETERTWCPHTLWSWGPDGTSIESWPFRPS